MEDAVVGYLSCLVAVVFFGSNFVPVKRTPTGDGMFFTLIMTAAVWLEGAIMQVARGNPKFEPFAMLGGTLWATGNITVVPIVKTIGLGLGLLTWGLLNMLVGWASGHFGLFGLKPDPPLRYPALNYAGIVLAVASLVVYAFIKSEVAEQGVAEEEEEEDGDSDINGDLQEGLLAPNDLIHSRQGLEGRYGSTPPVAHGGGGAAAAAAARSRFVLGFTLSVIAGIFYGSNFNPPQYLIEHSG